MRVNGVEVLVEGAGRQAVVMIHGWPDTLRLWDGQVAALQDRYRCVRFTLPGFDKNERRKAYTLDELIAFMDEVIERVSPGKPVILMLHDWAVPSAISTTCATAKRSRRSSASTLAIHLPRAAC